MGRWWCRTAARICAVPAPKTCCNGPRHSGRSSALHARKTEATLWRDSVGAGSHRPLTAFPNRRFPAIHLASDDGGAGHLQVTMMGEPDRIMARQILTSLVAVTFVCAASGLALAQGTTPPAAPKAAKKDAPKPPAAAKPEAAPAAAAAAAAGGAEPTL